MTDKMRQEFETWAKPLGFDMDYIYADDEFKCYCFTTTQNVFEVWKAGWEKSRDALCVELPMEYKDQFNELSYSAPAVINAILDSRVQYK